MSLKEEELPAEKGLPLNGFSKPFHLRTSGEFRNVFKNGRKIVTPTLVFHILKTNLSTTRLGLAVSKKVGNAVVRNKVRRRIKEVFRTRKSGFQDQFDMVVYPRFGILTRKFGDYHQSFDILLARLERFRSK